MPLFAGEEAIFFEPGIDDFHKRPHHREPAFTFRHVRVPIFLVRIFFGRSPVDTNPIGDILYGAAFYFAQKPDILLLRHFQHPFESPSSMS